MFCRFLVSLAILKITFALLKFSLSRLVDGGGRSLKGIWVTEKSIGRVGLRYAGGGWLVGIHRPGKMLICLILNAIAGRINKTHS